MCFTAVQELGQIQENYPDIVVKMSSGLYQLGPEINLHLWSLYNVSSLFTEREYSKLIIRQINK